MTSRMMMVWCVGLAGWVSIGLSCVGSASRVKSRGTTLEAPEYSAGSPGVAASRIVSDEAMRGRSVPNIPRIRPSGVQPIVIRTADITAEVEDVASIALEITRIAESMEGYVLSSSAFKTEGERENVEITLKVPSPRFFESLERIKKAIGEIESERISGEDVTEEYVDLEARQASLEATYRRLLDLLRIAKNAKEALEVNHALDQVTEQLEQVKGRMRYLRESAEMSTINVHLRSLAKVLPAVKTEKWSPLHTLKSAFAFSLDSLKAVGSVVIWAIAGFWYLFAVALALLGIRARRRTASPPGK